MATSTYFRNFDARNDQELLHSLTTESIQIHGYDVNYIPRTLVNEDKILGKRGIQVREDDGRLKITSGSFGSRSKIEIEPGKDIDLSNLGLSNGESVIGKDVLGTIDGLKAKGRGQLLVGVEGNPSEGLRVYVNINDSDLWLWQLDDFGQPFSLWKQVPALAGNNAIYNSLAKSERDIYNVVTKVNDTVDLVFGDGNFSALPLGTFRVYTRTSDNAQFAIQLSLIHI